ncbi:MAG: hypothetical protein LAQ30_14705 [Acidobacteriia bacterium]|nr:hypothetical protein [Terriglobia bacterium]
MRIRLLLASVLVLVVAATSCSNQPAPPKPGTAAFYWSAARTTYHSGDFVKASENLVQLITTENEFTGRARPWGLVVSAGLARGYSDLADIYDAGAKANRQNPTPFFKEASALRSAASAAALEFTEGAHQFLGKNKDPNVTLAFEFPTGSAAEPPALKRISGGILIQDSERDLLLKAMLQRGVVLSACEALGSADDTAQALEKLKTGEAQMPRNVFLVALAKTLQAQSELYGPKKLDKPDRAQTLLQVAQESLKEVPETKQSKELNGKVMAALKKIKKG